MPLAKQKLATIPDELGKPPEQGRDQRISPFKRVPVRVEACAMQPLGIAALLQFHLLGHQEVIWPTLNNYFPIQVLRQSHSMLTHPEFFRSTLSGGLLCT
jgi:hypothetical protein